MLACPLRLGAPSYEKSWIRSWRAAKSKRKTVWSVERAAYNSRMIATSHALGIT